MPTATETIENLVKQEYKYGFFTDVETDSAPPGLSEDTIRLISRRKNEPEWLTDWRLKAYRHWQTMTEADLAEGPSRKNQLSGHRLLLRAGEERRRAEKPGGS